MLFRNYGSTNEKLSIVGFGGIMLDKVAQSDANDYVAEAIDYGVNYFDVAPTYGDAEDKLGPALKPYRDKVFLACKTGERTKQEAKAELHRSLEKLKTDRFDLYQLHAMTTEEDFQQAMGPNGALEAFLDAREQGLVRYLGFSAHSVEVALKLIEHFEFDSCLVPVNFVNWFNGDFGMQIVERANHKGMGVLAIKAMAKTLVPEGEEKPNPRCWYAPIEEKEIAKLAYRYTLSQPITAAIPPGDIKLFRWGIEAITDFKPVTDEEVAKLKDYAKGVAPVFSYPHVQEA